MDCHIEALSFSTVDSLPHTGWYIRFYKNIKCWKKHFLFLKNLFFLSTNDETANFGLDLSSLKIHESFSQMWHKRLFCKVLTKVWKTQQFWLVSFYWTIGIHDSSRIPIQNQAIRRSFYAMKLPLIVVQ